MVCSASPALAGGYMVEEQSVRGLGRAYSGEVADQGAASLFWNPAAIARSGPELYLGGHARRSSSTLADAGSTITRPIPPAGLTTPVGGAATTKDPLGDHIAPNLALAVPLNSRLAVGLSLYEPFALDTDMGANSWARYDTLLARIDTLAVRGSAALAVTDWLDVGLGVEAQKIDAELQIALPNLSPLLPDGKTGVDGKGWEYGWSLGAQAHAGAVTLGASYHSRIKRSVDGTFSVTGLLDPLASANFTAPSKLQLETPWTLSVGARWQATDRLALNAQLTRYGWGEYDAIRIVAAGQTTVVPQNYSDTTAFALGADFAMNAAWTVRAGVLFDQTPTPPDLREAGVPDSNRRLFGAGASFQASDALTLDAAIGYSDFSSARVFHDVTNYAGTPALTQAAVRGTIDRSTVVISLGARWGF